MALLDLVEADEAVHPGHAQVEHDQVGARLRDERGSTFSPVLDLRMPGMDGLICLDQIKKRHPSVKVVVLSVSTDNTTTFTEGWRFLIWSRQMRPSIPGMIRQTRPGRGSSRTTSGSTLLARARLAHHLELAVVLQGTSDPGQDQAVIIRDDDFQHSFSPYRPNEDFT